VAALSVADVRVLAEDEIAAVERAVRRVPDPKELGASAGLR
jgi:hypothetical protein